MNGGLKMKYSNFRAGKNISLRISKLGLEYFYDYRSILYIQKYKIWKNHHYWDYDKHSIGI